MDKILKMGVLAICIACLSGIFYQPTLSASELSVEELSADQLDELTEDQSEELTEDELTVYNLSALEFSEEEVMCIVLLSHKYSVPEEVICRLLVEYDSSVDPESLCASEDPESLAECYKAQLEDLSKQLDISKETLASMVLDCKILNLMAHGFSSKMDKYINLEKN